MKEYHDITEDSDDDLDDEDLKDVFGEDDESDEYSEIYGKRIDWVMDAERGGVFTNAYSAFLENDCIGILSYEDALKEYRRVYGRYCEGQMECPEIEWVQGCRKEFAELYENPETRFLAFFSLCCMIDPETPFPCIKDAKVEDLIAKYFPFEPMMKYGPL